MDTSIARLVEQIHGSPAMVVLVVAGAGSRAMAWLLEVPGASRTVLEATVPYAPRAMEGLLGHEPEQYVSQETALDMARAAYRRALRLRPSQERVVGLACTATIATDRPKRGEHRCWIAAWDSEGAATCSLRLAKGLRDRPAEEDLVSRILLNSLAQANGLPERLPLDLAGEEAVEYGELEHPEPLRLLLYPQAGDERPRYVLAQPDGRREVEAPVRGAVLPGSFNPLHRGHVELARAASEILGQDVVFEMSVVNVDKPPLEEEEVRRRLNQFKDGWDGWTVALTRTPTFREKAGLFPGCPFVIGLDTAERVVQGKYYGGEAAAVGRALEEIRAAGCRFLVAGRIEGGEFRTLEDMAIPRGFADLFQAIPESAFRADLSSTELRASGNTAEETAPRHRPTPGD